MTDLERPVKRRLCRPAEGTLRRLVVILEPGDTLAMREAGRRTIYRGSLEKIYWVLAKWHADEARRALSVERGPAIAGGARRRKSHV